MSEHDANRALADTARLRALPDPLEHTQRMPAHARRLRQVEARLATLGISTDAEVKAAHSHILRERRKPSTVGTRDERTAAEHARDVIADRQQELIEAGIWPQY